MTTLAEVHQQYLAQAFRFVLPEVALLLGACALFILGMISSRRSLAFALGWVILAAAAGLALVLTLPSLGQPLGFLEVTYFWQLADGHPAHPRHLSPFDPTGVANFTRFLALGLGAVLLLLSWYETKTAFAAESIGCQIVVIAGLSLTARANDLVSLYIALEMLSIPTYILLYLPSQARPAQEAALKYFLLSVLSSAVMLFGFSYLYGQTGTTNLGAMLTLLGQEETVGSLGLIGILLTIAGLGFRLTAVPFHFYAPDVYQGGPTGVIAQLSYVPKVAGFIALARLLGFLFPPLERLPFAVDSSLVPWVLWVLAAVTMTLGNCLALVQENLRRLLAYSGVAHAGYMLIGVLATATWTAERGSIPSIGFDSVLFYLVAYGLMTVGAFAILSYLAQGQRPTETTDDLAGLSQTHPLAAGLFAWLLISMIGLPLTAGFAGKFLLFVGLFRVPSEGAMQSWPQLLVGIAAVNAAIGAVYYLRLIGVMYLRSPLQPLVTQGGRLALGAAVICALGTFVIGVYPKPLQDATQAVLPAQDDRPASAGGPVAILPPQP